MIPSYCEILPLIALVEASRFALISSFTDLEVALRFGESYGADRVHHSGQGRNGIVWGQSVVREKFPDKMDVTVDFHFGVRDRIAFVLDLGSPGAARACVKKGPACHEDHKVNPYYGWEGRVGHAVSCQWDMAVIWQYTMGYNKDVYDKLRVGTLWDSNRY